MRQLLLLISPQHHFKKLPAVVPKRGENRQLYFWRIFSGKFLKKEEKLINEFFEKHGRAPMLPYWVKDPCYMVCAIRFFSGNPKASRMCSALYYADLTAAYPSLKNLILEKAQRMYGELELKTETNPNHYVKDLQEFHAMLKTRKRKNKK